MTSASLGFLDGDTATLSRGKANGGGGFFRWFGSVPVGSWSWFFLFLVLFVASGRTMLGAGEAYLLGRSIHGGGVVTGSCGTMDGIIYYPFGDGSPCLLHRLASWVGIGGFLVGDLLLSSTFDGSVFVRLFLAAGEGTGGGGVLLQLSWPLVIGGGGGGSDSGGGSAADGGYGIKLLLGLLVGGCGSRVIGLLQLVYLGLGFCNWLWVFIFYFYVLIFDGSANSLT